jgi:hypothetical protein
LIPSKTNVQWRKLISGETNYEFNVLAAGLMLSRMRREIKASPDAETMQRCIDEAYVFFQKYESVLGRDITNLFGQEN